MLTDEQKAVRVTKVMASEICAFMDEHPYQSRMEAWALNLGLTEFGGNEATRMGDYLEPGLRDAAADMLEWPSYVEPGTIFHPRTLWAGCTPDMWSPEGVVPASGVQIKNSGLHMAKDYDGEPTALDAVGFDNDIIPFYHLVQCQWEMFVSRRTRWFLGVYFGGRDFRLYKLVYDPELVGLLVEAGGAFWEHHLDPNGPQEEPAPGGDKGSERYLRGKYPKNVDDLILPTDDHVDLRRKYEELKNKSKEVETSMETIKQTLMGEVGLHDGIDGICTWKLSKPKPKVKWEELAHNIFKIHELAVKGSGGKLAFDMQTLQNDFSFTPDGSRTFLFKNLGN